MKVERAAEAPLVYGDTLAADVRAAYLHGAPMVGAKVSYTLRRSDTAFRPPGSENEPFSFSRPRSRGGCGAAVSGKRGMWGGDWGGGVPDVLVKQGSGDTNSAGVFAVGRRLLQAKEQPWGEKPTPAPADAAPPKGPPNPPSAGTYTLEEQGHRPEPPGDRRPPSPSSTPPAARSASAATAASTRRASAPASRRSSPALRRQTGPGRAIKVELVRSETKNRGRGEGPLNLQIRGPSTCPPAAAS